MSFYVNTAFNPSGAPTGTSGTSGASHGMYANTNEVVSAFNNLTLSTTSDAPAGVINSSATPSGSGSGLTSMYVNSSQIGVAGPGPLERQGSGGGNPGMTRMTSASSSGDRDRAPSRVLRPAAELLGSAEPSAKTVNDKEAKEWWAREFKEEPAVPIARFSESLAKEFKSYPSEIVYKIVDHVVAGDRLIANAKEIDASMLVRFLKKFGPFTQCVDRCARNLLDATGEIQPWFHGNIPRDPNAIAKIFQQKVNRHLVRTSTNHDDFVLVQSRQKSNVFSSKQNKLSFTEGKGYYVDEKEEGGTYSSEPQTPAGKRTFYESLVELLDGLPGSEMKQSDLSIVLCMGRKYEAPKAKFYTKPENPGDAVSYNDHLTKRRNLLKAYNDKVKPVSRSSTFNGQAGAVLRQGSHNTGQPFVNNYANIDVSPFSPGSSSSGSGSSTPTTGQPPLLHGSSQTGLNTGNPASNYLNMSAMQFPGMGINSGAISGSGAVTAQSSGSSGSHVGAGQSMYSNFSGDALQGLVGTSGQTHGSGASTGSAHSTPSTGSMYQQHNPFG